MAEPWIRVHAGLIDKPVIDRLSTALDVSEHEAIGLLVTFWGAVSKNVVGGQLAGVSDRHIERWARWTGARGAFAAWIQAHHLDADGRVNEWEEYAGALEDRREYDRERKRRDRERKSHGMSTGSPTEVHRTVRVTSAPTIRDDTKQQPSSTARVSYDTLWEALSPETRSVVIGIATKSASPDACFIALASMLTGNDPATPRPSLHAFGQAIRDFAANGAQWNAAHFRTYLKRAAKDAEPAVNGNGRAAQGRAALVLGEIRELIQSHQQPGQGITRFIRRDDVERLGTDVLAAYDAIGGSERVIGATGEKMSFLIRDFADALRAASEVAA
jgi:hypothetical protein